MMSDVMKVLIQDNHGHTLHLLDISLQDGFLPTVGDKEKVELSLPSMEPALWCKVLILDEVMISCCDQSITWTITIDENVSIQHVHNFMEDCSSCDDEDELFELARDIINKPLEDYSMAVLRILHCYVLPRISFNSNDIKKVELARRQQASNIHRLTDKLEAKCFDVADCQEKLESIQEHFLPYLNKMIDNDQCSKQFLDLLLCDLVKLEGRVREKVLIAQLRYVDLVPTQPSGLRKTSLELLEAKQERDFLDKKLVSVLTAREVIIDRKERLSAELVTQPCPVLDSYMDKRSLLYTLEEDKNKLTQKQHCALMIREMLDTMLTDLYEHGFTQGDYADEQGARPTDVLQGGLQPEWQKLSERVATLATTSKHPIGKSFAKFCSDINSICQEPFANGKNNILKYSQSTFYVSLKPTEILPDSDYISVEMNTIIDPYKEKLYKFKDKVSQHMASMTKQLSAYFNRIEKHFPEKLRLAYEACFYEKQHKGISWLYEKVYAEMIQEISLDIQRIKDRFPSDLTSTSVNMIFEVLFESKLKTDGFISSFETNGYSEFSTTVDKESNSTSYATSQDLGLSQRRSLSSRYYGSYVNIADEAVSMAAQPDHHDHMADVVATEKQESHYDDIHGEVVSMVTPASHCDNTCMPTDRDTMATQSYDYISSCEDIVNSTFQVSTNGDYGLSDYVESYEDIRRQTPMYTINKINENGRECKYLRNRSIMKAKRYLINVVKDCCQSYSLKSDNIGSLGSLIDVWDSKVRPISVSLERSISLDNNGSQEKSCSDNENSYIQHEKNGQELPNEESFSNPKMTNSDEKKLQSSFDADDEPMVSKGVNKDMAYLNNEKEQNQATSAESKCFDYGSLTIDKAKLPNIINVRPIIDHKNDEYSSPIDSDKRPLNYDKSGSSFGEHKLPQSNISESSHIDENLSHTLQEKYDTFEVAFGPALCHIKAVFNATSPLAKLKHLKVSLDILMSNALDLQNSLGCYRNTLRRLTLDQCLPILVLLILQLQPLEIAKLCVQFVMLEDLISPGLYEGIYGQTLNYYQRAVGVIEDLWLQISQRQVDFTVNGIPVSKDIF